ncbi:MAG: trypsin-like peptidase domain-containing protein [Clostridia bacterium]|nr:trypsin-like peptidase domain-containing protein [Clostridia bacterium]
MKKRMYLGIVAVLLAVVMIGVTVITANAATNGLSEKEIDAIVNTSTDQSKIDSPFLSVVNEVRNSVVGVNNYATTTSYYGYGFGYGYGRPESQESLRGTGSGVVITKYGHVLTNYHVVEGASRVTVTTGTDEEEHEASVVGYDANLDIAVLEVKGLDLKPVELGDSDAMQVGEWAIVIGNPLGERFSRSVSVGVVSGLGREVTDQSMDKYGRISTITNTMIQTDAAINSGNSGGGMFNILGQLQGIPAMYALSSSSSSFFFSTGEQADNIGLCIPINVAKPLITEVLKDYNSNSNGNSADTRSQNSGEKEERVDSPLYGKPRLGVTITTLSNSSRFGLPAGAFVRAVEAGSPADDGGIKVGDIVVEMDGTVLDSQNALITKLNGYHEGDQVHLKVYRDPELTEKTNLETVDVNKLGKGEYIDLTITLRVVDNMNF